MREYWEKPEVLYIKDMTEEIGKMNIWNNIVSCWCWNFGTFWNNSFWEIYLCVIHPLSTIHQQSFFWQKGTHLLVPPLINVNVNVYVYSLISHWGQQTSQFTSRGLELSLYSLISSGENSSWSIKVSIAAQVCYHNYRMYTYKGSDTTRELRMGRIQHLRILLQL